MNKDRIRRARRELVMSTRDRWILSAAAVLACFVAAYMPDAGQWAGLVVTLRWIWD